MYFYHILSGCVLCGHMEKWKKKKKLRGLRAVYALHIHSACARGFKQFPKSILFLFYYFMSLCVCVYWIEWKCALVWRTPHRFICPFVSLPHIHFILYLSLERCLFYCFNWFFIWCNGAAIYSNWNKGVFFSFYFVNISVCVFYLSLFLYYGLQLCSFVCWPDKAPRPKPHLI